MNTMLFRPRTIVAMLALAAAVGIAGSALDFSGWAWYAAAVATVLLVTLTDRDRFYGRHRRALH